MTGSRMSLSRRDPFNIVNPGCSQPSEFWPTRTNHNQPTMHVRMYLYIHYILSVHTDLPCYLPGYLSIQPINLSISSTTNNMRQSDSHGHGVWFQVITHHPELIIRVYRYWFTAIDAAHGFGYFVAWFTPLCSFFRSTRDKLSCNTTSFKYTFCWIHLASCCVGEPMWKTAVTVPLFQ